MPPRGWRRPKLSRELSDLAARLARMVRAWQAENLAFHATNGCSHRPTEAVNLFISRSSTSDRLRNFTNYRLPLLLHCGVRWQTDQTPRLRGRSPRLVA
jgi:hypothetical protein